MREENTVTNPRQQSREGTRHIGGRYARLSPWLALALAGYLLASVVYAQSKLPSSDYQDLFNAKRETQYLSERLTKIEDLHLEAAKAQIEDMRNELAYQRTVMTAIAIAVIGNLLTGLLDWRKRRNGA